MMKQINYISTSLTSKTIQKTILSSVLQEGFWSRWIAHGLNKEVINKNKSYFINLDGWIKIFQDEAQNLITKANKFIEKEDFLQAEQHYRLASLYFNLIQWIFPESNDVKGMWYEKCLEVFEQADRLSENQIIKQSIKVKDKTFIGRVRKPQRDPLGVIIIVNPIDSNKEELFTYENDFAEAGFAVVNFDGPGQGESLLFNKHKANQESWSSFLENIIDFSNDTFPGIPIHLFGTSSGGAWAIEAGKHPLVSKIVAVSPPPKADIKMPDYFKERMLNMLEDFDKGFLPDLKELQLVENIIVFHGLQDVMIEDQDLYYLFDQLSSEKRLITYEDEGHCCNFRLPELRQRAMNWFKGEKINEV